MTVQNAALVECLADDAADELEEHQMLRIDATETVGVESGAIGSDRNEESVVGVEHASSEDLEPFSSDSTGVHTLLAVEANVEFSILDSSAFLKYSDLKESRKT